MIRVTIWNRPIESFFAIVMDGAMEELFKPVSYKGVIESSSEWTDGKQMYLGQRCIEPREVSLSFAVYGGSETEFQHNWSVLENYLMGTITGQDGYCSLKVQDGDDINATFWLVYESATMTKGWNGKWGEFNVKFDEPMPQRRTV